MKNSLRESVLALIAALTLSQNGTASEPIFSWPERGTVVTTKPDTGDNAGDDNSRKERRDSVLIYGQDQDPLPSTAQPATPAVELNENRDRSSTTAESLPAPGQQYRLPLSTSSVLEAEADSFYGEFEYVPTQTTPAVQYSRSQDEPVYERADPPSQFTVVELESDTIDDSYLASNISSWRPLLIPSQMLQNGFFVGGETTFLTAGRESYQAASIDSLISSARISGENASGLGAGGRGWIGLRSGKTGFIATAWHFNDENADAPGALFGKDAAGLARIYNLQATTVDLELFQEFCFMQSTLGASLGGRFADLRRRGHTSGFGSLDKADVYASSHGVTEMSGWGLTGSLTGYHPLRRPFKRHNNLETFVSPWSIQWLVRGAVINGETLVSARTEAQVSHTAGVARSVDGAIAEWEGVMSSGMLQLGIGYRRPLQCLPAFLDFATGFEGHIQQTGRVGVSSTSNAFLQGNDGSSDFGAASTAISNVNNRDIVLTGFFLRWSLNY